MHCRWRDSPLGNMIYTELAGNNTVHHARTRRNLAIHLRSRVHTHTHLPTRTHLHTHTRTQAHTHTHAHMHTRTHAHTHTLINELCTVDGAAHSGKHNKHTASWKKHSSPRENSTKFSHFLSPFASPFPLSRSPFPFSFFPISLSLFPCSFPFRLSLSLPPFPFPFSFPFFLSNYTWNFGVMYKLRNPKLWFCTKENWTRIFFAIYILFELEKKKTEFLLTRCVGNLSVAQIFPSFNWCV